MKLIKSYYKDEHKIVIRAKFIKDGYFPSWAYNPNEIKDLVKLEAKIYDQSIDNNVSEPFTYTRDAWVGRHIEVIKKRLFRKDLTESYTLHEEFEIALDKLEEDANEYIDRKIYSKKITDGLPNSLLDLI